MARGIRGVDALETRCVVCGKSSPLIAKTMGACAECIRGRPEAVLPGLERIHAETRREFNLPAAPPRAGDGARCALCVNECLIAEGERGFCGPRTNARGKLVHLAGTAKKGILQWYFDPLPTNCCAARVCEGSHQHNSKNLAVFYGACTMNCLFCQNWQYRWMSTQGKGMSAVELAAVADSRTFCACYFGGDPTPQMPHALAVSRILARRGVRICWETNGSMSPKLLDRAVRLSLETGGCLKFDLKAHDENLHKALTGVTNTRTLDNFARAASYIPDRRDSPLLVGCTLLVPGYVDPKEVYSIARFISSLDSTIPYSLLGFHPDFRLHDLPRTSVRHAEEAEQAARDAGLTNVHIGNRHLLSRD